MAGIWCEWQESANSSGTEAPSRKLKAEREWSSMYIAASVITRIGEPVAGSDIAVNTVENNIVTAFF